MKTEQAILRLMYDQHATDYWYDNLQKEEQIKSCIEYLSTLKPDLRFSSQVDAYRLKHVVEDLPGNGYIHAYSLVTAARRMRLRLRYEEDGTHPLIGVKYDWGDE